jgi:hypothetical protein
VYLFGVLVEEDLDRAVQNLKSEKQKVQRRMMRLQTILDQEDDFSTREENVPRELKSVRSAPKKFRDPAEIFAKR